MDQKKLKMLGFGGDMYNYIIHQGHSPSHQNVTVHGHFKDFVLDSKFLKNSKWLVLDI